MNSFFVVIFFILGFSLGFSLGFFDLNSAKRFLKKFKAGFEFFIFCLKDWTDHLKLAHCRFEDKLFWNNLNTEIYNDNIRFNKKAWIKHHKEAKELAFKANNNTTRLSDNFWSIFRECYFHGAALEELKALNYLSAISQNRFSWLGKLAINVIFYLELANEIEEAKTIAIRWIADSRIDEQHRQKLKNIYYYIHKKQ